MVNRRVAIQSLIGILATIAAVFLVAQSADLSAAIAALATVDPRWLVIALAILVVQMWVRSARWATILGAMVVPAWITARRLYWPLSTAYLANAVLPARLGEVVRIVVTTRRIGVTATAATASIVVDRVIDLVALLTVAAAAYGLVAGSGLIPLTVVLVGLTVLALALRSGTWLAARLPAAIPPKLGDLAARLLLAVGAVRPRLLTRSWLIGLAAWACDAAVMFVCALALGTEISPGTAVLIASGAALGAALPAAAGALGTYELGAVALAGVVGISVDTALQVALLGHLVGLVGVVTLGAIGGVIMTITAAAPRPVGERREVVAAVDPLRQVI